MHVTTVTMRVYASPSPPRTDVSRSISSQLQACRQRKSYWDGARQISLRAVRKRVVWNWQLISYGVIELKNVVAVGGGEGGGGRALARIVTVYR